MSLTLAAVRTGTDPVGPLPKGSFHRWLETQLLCPKCDACYAVVTDFDTAVGRFFERDAAGPLRMLAKAVRMGHADGHRVSHFETAGVVVKSYERPEAAGGPGEPTGAARAAGAGGEGRVAVRQSRMVH